MQRNIDFVSVLRFLNCFNDMVLFFLFLFNILKINVREYRRYSTKGQSRETNNTRRRKTKQKHNTIYVGHHYAQPNTNNVNKTCIRPLTNNWR